MMRKRLIIASLVALATVAACKHDEQKPLAGIDREMYDMATNTAGHIWYKDSDALLSKSSGSGHNSSFLRTRYNSIAATMLDANGKVKDGAVFPDGSLIVKELINNTTPVRYAILLKRSGHEAADSKGWIWSYLNADGTIAEPAANKGNICTGCHNQDGNIDYMLMNKFFP